MQQLENPKPAVDSGEMRFYTLDDLLQRAADNSRARLACLLDAIEIAALAAEMGPGAKRSVAEHLHYSTNTVSKLARMFDLPEDCINLDMKPGTYWVALLHADNPVQTIREAIAEEITTPTEMKRKIGMEQERHPPIMVGTARVQDIGNGKVTLLSDRICPEDNWPSDVKVTIRSNGDGKNGNV